MTRWERLAIWGLLSLGVQALVYFLTWWWTSPKIDNLLLFGLFSLAAWFSAFRMAANWFALLHVERPSHRPAPPGLRVDVMTTAAPGEPLEMFDATLRAMVAIRYPHTTYLLDDSGRDELRALCDRLGVRYVRRAWPGEGAKAGNVNHALALTNGEFVAIFDPDHIPHPDFLDRVLGQFSDTSVGYVQAAQAYRNQHESPVARGAAEQTYELFGPTMMGLQGLEAPLLFGCHTTFRRTALESIGGYAVHNAEDLRTCMRLTARGWKGVYVPEVLARGLVPADLKTYLRQQYRWAHSVFDLFFRDYWQLRRRWSFFQKAAFFMVGTFYFVGPAILINLLLPPLFLLTGWKGVSVTAGAFLVHLAPLLFCNLAIRRFGQRFLLDREERGWHPLGMILLFASAFAHTAGLLAAAANVRVPYLVTAKARQAAGLRQVRAHIAIAGLSVLAILYSLWMNQQAAGLMQAFALWNAVMMGGVIWIAVWEEDQQPDGTTVEDGTASAVHRLGGRPLVGDSVGR